MLNMLFKGSISRQLKQPWFHKLPQTIYIKLTFQTFLALFIMTKRALRDSLNSEIHLKY